MPNHDSDDFHDEDPLDVTLRYPSLPRWLERRLLYRDEYVTWVRGPASSPSLERYLTHPALALFPLAFGGLCWLGVYLLGKEAPYFFSVMGSIWLLLFLPLLFVVGISCGHFTRLVVTNFRLIIVQGHEVCRSWDVEELPPELTHYSRHGRRGKRSIDLSAVQDMLGNSSQQFTPAKAILEFGKQLDRIKIRPERTDADESRPEEEDDRRR